MNGIERTQELVRYINLKLSALGQPVSEATAEPYFLELAGPLLRNYRQRDLLLGEFLCPADRRIQEFLDSYLGKEETPRLPWRTLTLDRAGLARVMSVPAKGDHFRSKYLDSYRVAQGVLHNPAADRRTTQGIFHVVEGGLPVPADKLTVPKRAFARLLVEALRPPDELLRLPFTAGQAAEARVMVSLLLRPLVSPATAKEAEKRMEVRFFAPGSLVSNLDFVEAIFGNGGDPYLAENDAAQDVHHWTGHTGCVILAPHLAGISKQALGLPHWEEATERQRRDGMCWRSEGEAYNGGRPFKVTCRDERGVIVTIIADNYYGYCKKEVKTQISYAANLMGNAEEEHAGGAIAFASYVLGQDFYVGRTVRMMREAQLDEAVALLGEWVERMPEGYARDKRFPEIYYVPETAEFSVVDGEVRWRRGETVARLKLRAGAVYVLPSGYRIHLEKQEGGNRWRLIGTRQDGTLCHKPSTVSGGGKSEISKSIANAILKGPIFVKDFHADMERVAEILRMDFSTIYRTPPEGERAKRPILSPERSLGSVIKLLTPSAEYKEEYNEWLRGMPQTIRQLVCTVKRYYRPEWGERWREHFSVDRINGYLGHELKFEDERLVGNYLRVGFDADGAWRIFKLRPDFHPAAKVQVEDDITASVTVPAESLNDLDAQYKNASVKLLANCEAMLFQRPDDAVHRGFDRQAEADLAAEGTFLSNFEPLSHEQAQAIVDHVAQFDRYTEPMKQLLERFVRERPTDWVVASDQARLVDGKPSKNPRYLQRRPDLANPRETYLAEVCTRLYRQAPVGRRLYFPVNAVLSGRRGNPPEAGSKVPPLAVYSPIHYQELPELFMDLISSLTGKSPSTTGYGSEGALTKRPFNALPPVVDLNNALVSAVLTGYAGFTTAAGWVGPRVRVDHDISLLIPEVWCRMRVEEREPEYLIAEGYLERIRDFEYEGRRIAASRLGYRITERFADRFLGRIFETPNAVFTEEMLRPEKQDMGMFAAGVEAIVESQREVALEYFEDGTVAAACPPIRALLHIMAYGEWEGKGIEDAAIRRLFTREAVVESEWYEERLRKKQERDIALWRRHARVRDSEEVRRELARVSSAEYLASLRGTIGADPLAFG